jgi:hypothetical protein
VIGLMLTACLVKAVQPLPEHPEVLTGRFELVVPQGWETTRNGRGLGSHHLTLASPDGTSAITVDLIREDRTSRQLPLVVLVEGYAVDSGRGRGIESERLGSDRLDVAGREAWAVTVKRHSGPNERLASTVGLRGEQHLALLTLHTRAGAPSSVASAWSVVLDSFELPRELPVETPPFLDEALDEAAIDALPDFGP